MTSSSFFEICIRRPVLTWMMSAAIVVFGVVSLMRLPVRELPDVDPTVVNGNDVEMLEDLIVVAVAEAQKKAAEAMQMELSKVTGGIDLPFKLPF